MKIHSKTTASLALFTLVLSSPVMAAPTTYNADVITTVSFMENFAYTNEAALQINEATLSLVRNRDDKIYNGYDVWIAPLKSKNTKDNSIRSGSSSIKTGNYGSDLNLKGVSVGLEREFTHRKDFVGVLANIGKVDVNTKGIASHVNNDVDYYSMGLYGKFRMTKKFTMFTDVLFTHTKSDINAKIASVGSDDTMRSIRTDVRANIISAGLGMSYKKRFAYIDFYPHISARYTIFRNMDNHNFYNAVSQKIGSSEVEKIKFISVPFGLTATKSFVVGGVSIAPKFDITCTYNFFEDYDKDVKVGSNNVKVKSELIEKFGYNATLGVDVQYKSFDFGLNASFGKDSDTDRSSLLASVSYAF